MERDGRKEVIDNLTNAIAAASEALMTLKAVNNGTYNESGEKIQFDYCTSDELARKVNSLETITKEIEAITFRRKKRK